MSVNVRSTIGRVRYLHLSLVVTDKRAAVVLDDRRQLRRSELAVGHPARQLVVPDAIVTTEELAVCLGKVCNLVATGESEGAFSGFRSILATFLLAMLIVSAIEKAHYYPFHAVPGRDLPKLLRVREQGDIRRVRELRVVRCAPKVQLARLLRERVQARRRARRRRARRRRIRWCRSLPRSFSTLAVASSSEARGGGGGEWGRKGRGRESHLSM